MFKIDIYYSIIYIYMATSMNINMMIAGPVSAGKSTLTNLLFVEQYSDMKIKRTTAVPQVYHEVDSLAKVPNLQNILKNNRDINTRMMAESEKPDYKLKLEDVKEIEYYVPKLFDFVELKKDVLLTIYDTPGLNDSRTKEVYYEYIRNNFNKFDIVLFVLDINSAMNTSDETDILTMILNNIKKNKNEHNIETHLIVLLNKCDDMVLNKQTKKYELDDELKNMYIQADTIIKNMIKEIYNGFKYHILPISCENSYIYRMYKKNPATKLDEKHLNKFGANEYGKTRWNGLSEIKKQSQISKLFKKFDYDDRINMSGFKELKLQMQKIFNDANQFNYLLNHIKYSLNLVLVNSCKNDIMSELTHSYTSLQYLNELIRIFNRPQTEYKFLFDKIDTFYIAYYEYILNTILQLQKDPSEESSISIYNLIHNNMTFYVNNFWTNRVFVDNKKIYDLILYKTTKVINDILKNINIIWINKLNDSNISSDKMMMYLDKLYENKYELLQELIVRKLSNVDFYSVIYDEHIYTVNICNMLDCIETKYKMDRETVTELAITILTNTYTIYMKKDVSVLNRFTKFWQQIVINSSNKYYDDVSIFKNCNYADFTTTMTTMIKNKGNNVPINFLSEYIVSRIKKSYPEDIISQDELISMFYKIKQNKVSVSNSIESIANENSNEEDEEEEYEEEQEVIIEVNEKKEDKSESSDELSDEINNELQSDDEEQQVVKNQTQEYI